MKKVKKTYVIFWIPPKELMRELLEFQKKKRGIKG